MAPLTRGMKRKIKCEVEETKRKAQRLAQRRRKSDPEVIVVLDSSDEGLMDTVDSSSSGNESDTSDRGFRGWDVAGYEADGSEASTPCRPTPAKWIPVVHPQQNTKAMKKASIGPRQKIVVAPSRTPRRATGRREKKTIKDKVLQKRDKELCSLQKYWQKKKAKKQASAPRSASHTRTQTAPTPAATIPPAPASVTQTSPEGPPAPVNLPTPPSSSSLASSASQSPPTSPAPTPSPASPSSPVSPAPTSRPFSPASPVSPAPTSTPASPASPVSPAPKSSPASPASPVSPAPSSSPNSSAPSKHLNTPMVEASTSKPDDTGTHDVPATENPQIGVNHESSKCIPPVSSEMGDSSIGQVRDQDPSGHVTDDSNENHEVEETETVHSPATNSTAENNAVENISVDDQSTGNIPNQDRGADEVQIEGNQRLDNPNDANQLVRPPRRERRLVICAMLKERIRERRFHARMAARLDRPRNEANLTMNVPATGAGINGDRRLNENRPLPVIISHERRRHRVPYQLNNEGEVVRENRGRDRTLCAGTSQMQHHWVPNPGNQRQWETPRGNAQGQFRFNNNQQRNDSNYHHHHDYDNHYTNDAHGDHSSSDNGVYGHNSSTSSNINGNNYNLYYYNFNHQN